MKQSGTARNGNVFWALGVVPAEHEGTLRAALAAYCSDTDEQHFETDALLAFAIAMRQLLAPILQQRTPE